jgi:hypothetical protein
MKRQKKSDEQKESVVDFVERQKAAKDLENLTKELHKK